MRHCDFSLPTPALNLSADEALLDWCEEGHSGPLLRFWEPQQYFVVVGYANRVAEEVNVPACREAGVPIFRRCTGGGTVLQGPGVLNYNLILKIDAAQSTHTIPATNQFVLERQRLALSDSLSLGERAGERASGNPPPAAEVQIRGQSDLAILDVKCCGNAQRRKKSFLIFHGSFLLGLDPAMIEKTLRMPSKQPDYRANRPHSEFVRNISINPEALKQAIRHQWQARELFTEIPFPQIEQLAAEKYSTDEWNFRF